MKPERFVRPRLEGLLYWCICFFWLSADVTSASKKPSVPKAKTSVSRSIGTTRPARVTIQKRTKTPRKTNARPVHNRAVRSTHVQHKRPSSTRRRSEAHSNEPKERRLQSVKKKEKRKRRKSAFTFESTTKTRRYRAPTAASGEVKQSVLKTFAQNQAADVLQAVPGLYASQHTGRGKAQQFFLRGFDAVHGSDLELRVQGIPINEASNIHGQGYADIGFIPGRTMLRLRYLKGPFLGRQGDFAITGTLEWDLGLDARGVILQAGLGSFLRREALVAWGPKHMGKETFVVAQFGESDGFGTDRAWLEGKTMAQIKLRWRQYWLRLMMGLHYSRFGSGGVLREHDLNSGHIGFYDAQQAGLGGHTGRWIAQATIGWRDTERQSAYQVMMYATGRQLRLKENFTGQLLYDKGDTFEQRHSFVQVGGMATYRRSWFWWMRRQQLRMGVEFRYDDIAQTQYRLDNKDIRHTTEIDAKVHAYQLAAWSTLRLRFWRWLQWDVALRATVLGLAVEELAPARSGDIRGPSRDGIGLHFAPRSSLRFRLHRQWYMFASYGLGFRSTQARSLNPNQRTPFQEAHSAELGVRFRSKGWFEASLALFSTYVAQELIFDHATANNLYAGPSWRFGGELDFKVRLYYRWLWLDTSVTYSEGIFASKGTPVPFAPRLLMRNGLVVQWQSPDRFWKLMFSLRASLLGPRPLPQGLQADTVFLLNAVARLDIGPAFIRIDGQNILNRQWKDGQFVYTSAFKKGITQKLPQLHFSAGHPLQIFVTLGWRLFTSDS